MNEQTQRLAAEFCRILHEWLTPDQIAEAVFFNANEKNPGVCHSHDHCDANQAMLDAWEVVFGKGRVPAYIDSDRTEAEKNAELKITNDAWNMAKVDGFKLCRDRLDFNGVTLYRYAGRVKNGDEVFGGEYVDWFKDDDDARATYRVIMEQQGYKVKTVTIGHPCIVEIE
jgi:hypothetical protein